jgi:hypothetical protein
MKNVSIRNRNSMNKKAPSEKALEDSLHIVGGLASGIVWQRNRENLSDQSIQIEAATAGEVFVRVAKGNSSVFEKSYRVGRGSVSLRIKGVPAGGSYTVDINHQPDEGASWKKTFYSVWVGDVWILGGQSNMQGCGLLTKDFMTHPAIRAFYMDDRWEVAKDPLHNLWQAVDPVHESINGGPWDRGNPNLGAGRGPAKPLELDAAGCENGNLRSFHAGVREGTAVYPSLHDGALAVSVVFAAEESARRGQPVRMEEIFSSLSVPSTGAETLRTTASSI